MRIIKIIFHILIILSGAIVSLYSFIKLLYCFNGFTKAKDANEVGFYFGYLAASIIMGSLFAWIFWKGISYFIKKQKMTKEEIEKMIDDI